MGASRFEVFNTETGESLFEWPFPVPEASPRRRHLALAHAREYALASRSPCCVRLWEGSSQWPVVVFRPPQGRAASHW